MDKDTFSSFLLGLGLGVGLGLLFAPKTGAETRTLIKNKAGEGTDDLKQRSTEFRDNAGELIDKGRRRSNASAAPSRTPWRRASRRITTPSATSVSRRGPRPIAAPRPA